MTDEIDAPTERPSAVREARRAMYRERILAAAETEFATRGFAETKMASIAATSGLSLATVYKNADGKSEIWDDLHTERMADLLAEVGVATARPGSVVERIVAGAVAVARFLAVHESYLDMNLRTGTGWAGDTGFGRGTQKSVWDAGRQQLTAAVRVAVDRGEIGGQSPTIVTGMMVSALQVWLGDWVAGGRATPVDVLLAGIDAQLRWLLSGPDTALG